MSRLGLLAAALAACGPTRTAVLRTPSLDRTFIQRVAHVTIPRVWSAIALPASAGFNTMVGFQGLGAGRMICLAMDGLPGGL